MVLFFSAGLVFSRAMDIEKGINACCGYVSDSADLLPTFDQTVLPARGNFSICINCGSLLVYRDGQRNLTRLATRIETELLNSAQRRYIRKAQRYIRKRGWIRKPGLS